MKMLSMLLFCGNLFSSCMISEFVLYDCVGDLRLVSKSFFEMFDKWFWSKTKDCVAKQYCEFGIFNDNKNCDIENINNHFLELSRATSLSREQQDQFLANIISYCGARRRSLIFQYLNPNYGFFQEQHFEKNNYRCQHGNCYGCRCHTYGYDGEKIIFDTYISWASLKVSTKIKKLKNIQESKPKKVIFNVARIEGLVYNLLPKKEYREQVVDLLYNAVDWTGNTLLYYLVDQLINYLEEEGQDTRSLTKKCIEKRYNLDFRYNLNQTLLHHACRSGQEEIVKWLLEAGASVHVRDRCGETPLHFACAGGFGNIIKLLLQYGANPNVESSGLKTPLDELAKHFRQVPGDFTKCASILFDQGFNLKKDRKGYHRWIHDYSEFLEFYLKNGFNQNTRYPDGTTVLHRSVRDVQNGTSFALLLRYGANQDARDNDDQTAKDRAILLWGENVTARLLKSAKTNGSSGNKQYIS